MNKLTIWKTAEDIFSKYWSCWQHREIAHYIVCMNRLCHRRRRCEHTTLNKYTVA